MKSNVSILLMTMTLLVSSCKPAPQSPTSSATYHQIKGQTWGTYYSLTLQCSEAEHHHQAIRQILKDFDDVLSTYVPQSVISQFNSNSEGIVLTSDQDQYFAPVLARSRELSESTQGYLDVTVMPLLNYWGFGYKGERKSVEDVTTEQVDSLLMLQGLHHISRKEKDSGHIYYSKSNASTELDFSALAKGYGIDVIASYLERQDVHNYLIDIGGEARCKGVNASGEAWRLAINKPDAKANYTTMELIVQLHDQSIATSGNYREMYEIDGKVYGHIINPKTGYPEPSDVLSATIVATDCMTADALATACVAAGLHKAKEILAAHEDVHGCLIYDADGDAQLEKYYTGAFEDMTEIVE